VRYGADQHKAAALQRRLIAVDMVAKKPSKKRKASLAAQQEVPLRIILTALADYDTG